MKQARHSYAETSCAASKTVRGALNQRECHRKRQELRIADAGLSTPARELSRVGFDRLRRWRHNDANLKLVAPVDGAGRAAQCRSRHDRRRQARQSWKLSIQESGGSIRFDQISAAGLAMGCRTFVCVRVAARQLEWPRAAVEPMADAVTEEMLLAKGDFPTQTRKFLPPIG